MASIIILLTSILLFALVGRLLGKELISKRHLFGWNENYSPTALRVERNYKILAFAVLEGLLLWALITSMITLISTDPF